GGRYRGARHRWIGRIVPEGCRLRMTRHVFLVHLRDDPAAVAAYREHHQRVWPEVIASLRRSGVQSMDIHLLGRTAVVMVGAADGTDVRHAFAAHHASSARVAEREQLINSLQEPSPHP